MKHKITELEGLRGVLAWWVIAGHCLVLSGIQKLPLPLRPLLRGDTAVEVFIILSGFVIFMLLDKENLGYGTFITRRFFRLFPTYFICLAVMIPVSTYAVAAISRLPWAGDATIQWIVSDWEAARSHLWQQIAMHVTMLHGLLPNEILRDSASGILGPAWSISLEWQFYLIAPLLFLAIRRSLAWRCVIFALVAACFVSAPSFGSMFLKGRIATYPLPAFLPLRAEFFFCGACSYFFYKKAKQNATPERFAGFALPLLLMVLIFTKSLSLAIWCYTLGSSLLRSGSLKGRKLFVANRVLNSPLFQWAGRISYSSYLCHVPVLYCVMLAMLHFRHTWGQGLFLFTLAGVASPLILICSHVLFTMVEHPFIVAAKKWTSAPKMGPEIAVIPPLAAEIDSAQAAVAASLGQAL